MDKAIQDADKCIELQPEFVKGYHRKASALFAMGTEAKTAEAVEVILVALEAGYDTGNDLVRLGVQVMSEPVTPSPQARPSRSRADARVRASRAARSRPNARASDCPRAHTRGRERGPGRRPQSSACAREAACAPLAPQMKGKAFVKLADARRKGTVPEPSPAPEAAAVSKAEKEAAAAAPPSTRSIGGQGLPGGGQKHLYQLDPEEFAAAMIKDVFDETLRTQKVPTICYMQCASGPPNAARTRGRIGADRARSA